MECKISRNPFRLLASSFMVLHPVKHGEYHKHGIYNLSIPKYGRMGQVTCVNEYKVFFNQVTETMERLADGIGFMDKLYKQGYQKTDMMQVVIFHFVRRSDTNFTTMMEQELPGIGLILTHQKNLFANAG